MIALVALAGLLLFSGQVSLSAQGTNPLARRWADVRVQGEENRFLLQSQQITAEEAQRRTGLMNTELAAIRAAMNALPRPVQTEITQQAETLFQVRIVPLREQWNQALAEKRLADQARFAELTKELQADAAVSGKVQAERTLLRERAQRGEVSQADATRTDQQAEQQILALHRKYDALDMERAAIGQRPYWASQFSRAEAAFAARAVAEGRVRLRLDDTQTEIGKDAHRAANLTLSMQRNQLFQAQLAITPQEAQSLNATAQALLTSLQQKYATSPAAADYRDRVVRLVQEGAAAQRPQWERDAAAAKVEAAARRAAAAAPPAQQVGVPAGNPQPVPLETSQPAPTSDGRRTARGPTTSGARPVPRAPQTPPVVLATQIPRQTPGGGIPWTPVIVLLLLGAGGAGAYALRARMATAPPTFAPAPHITDPVQTSGTGAGHASAQRASSTEVPPAPGIGGLKEHLLAQQREKYQTRYNDALDEVTNASMALTQMAPLLSSAHANLHTLSTSLYGRVHAVIVARYGSLWKALMNAALLRPVWRLFRRVPVLPKIGIGVGLYFLWSRIFQAFSAGDFATVVLIYGGIVAAGFFIERHLVLKAPLALLKRNAGEFKALRLAHLYVDQRPEVIQGQSALRGLRILAADTLPLAHDEAFEASVGAGTFLLGVGTLGSYRVDPSGSTTVLTSAQGNEFMNQHGGLLLEVVSQLGDFAPNTFPPLAQYGQVHWRKQRAANALPQLEALVRDVDRIEKVWQDVYVSDEVFEFLFRSIDMFNMRDAATPPGLLLYGLPGNGKKYLARKIADTLSARFEQVTPSKIASADQIKDLWTASRGTDPVVLFVPNAETVFPKTQDGTSARDTLEWIAEWEKHEPRESRVWVVMTGRSDEAMDPAVLDHVGRDSKIEVQGPDTAGREVLLQMACRQYQVSAPPSDTVAKTMGGVSIQDLRRIVMAAKRAAAPGQPQDSHWKQAIQTVRGADAKFKDETKTWDRLILPPKIKEQLQLACKVLQDAQESKKKGLEVPRVLLFGPPGTGKTEIARTIANEAGVNFMEGSLAKMKGKYIGSSGQMVTELFAKARASAPTVLFLDEIDAVSKERGSEGTDSFTDDITNVLLTELEGVSKPDRPVFILAATNHHEVMDEAILRRFKRKIEIPKPDEWGRREILKVLFSDRRDAIDFDIEDVATVVAKRTDGQAGSFLRDLVQKAMEEAELVAQATSPPGTVRLTRDLVMAETERLRREGSDGVDPTATWDTLVLSDQTMNELKRLSRALRNMEERLRQGVEPPRGAVLFGPPGTGKTQIAKTLANESGVRFLLKGPADLGRTAESVRELFNAARKKAPCILFIDEFENAAKSRDLGGSAEVVTELLSQIQGAKKETRPIFVLAATNYLERVDKAVLDRFSAYQIEVPYPTPEQRERLFTVFLKKVPRIDFDIATTAAELAQLAGSVGGRRIYDSVDKALQEAANRAEEAGTGEPIVLRREDLLRQFAPKGRPVSEEDLTTVWSQIVLKPEVKDSLLSMIR
ncbi:MAG: AAA family ATPase, partial [Vicinamibacterales bacterium]